MKLSKIICSIFLLHLAIADQSLQCGDWDVFKDEWCFKVLVNSELQSYSNANKTCYQNEASSLVSIRSQEEQVFIYNLLHNYKVVNDVWIGGQFKENTFRWSDNSIVNFTNWANDNPKNESEYECVQMAIDANFNGKWLNEPCERKNLVVCERTQNWLFSYLQKTVIDLRESVQNITIHFENINKLLKIELENTKTQLQEEIIKKAVESTPAGTVVYFANQTSAPLGWLKANGQSVSRTTYANLFARIGTTFGSGDGSTTFTLPDLRGEFIRGWSDGRDVDTDRSFGSFQWGSHIHLVDAVNGSGGYAAVTGYQDRWGVTSKTFDDGIEYHIPSGQTRNEVTFPNDKSANEMLYVSAPNFGVITHWNLLKGTRPRNIALLACIKY